jgi:hypothetical protein
MRRLVIFLALFCFAVKSELQTDYQAPSSQQINIDSVPLAAPRKLPDTISPNQIFIQETDADGNSAYVAHGPSYKIPGNPLTGQPDMLPPNSLTAVIGQTPFHTNYQVIHQKRVTETPLNLLSYPRIYTPQFSPQHPLNLHHPFNNLYGMHPYMFTGDPSSAANMFMNPFAHAMTGMFANNNFPTAAAMNGMAAKISTDENSNQQPQALNPNPATGLGAAIPMVNPFALNNKLGFGPNFGGIGAFGPSMNFMGPMHTLSPRNTDYSNFGAFNRKLKQRRTARINHNGLVEKTSTENVTAENNKA